jgi:Domain of unknown function (DUF1839)
MTDLNAFWAATPGTHPQHGLHDLQRNFPETNCYIDVWIEILHGLKLDPHAFLACAIPGDFEGDQWTFFKPSHTDLAELYGITVEELTIWLPVIEHVQTQLERQRMPLVEVDAFFLPDTAGSDYRQAHSKTTIAIHRLDRGQHTLQYFHNAGFFSLHGDDFLGVFALQGDTEPKRLPPFAEFIKLERVLHLPSAQLRTLSRAQALRHFSRRPSENPLRKYGALVSRHLEQWVVRDNATYHAYSFASIRQLGASFELLADYVRWLDNAPGGPAAMAAEAFRSIATVAKMLILKLARVANSKRISDLSGNFDDMAASWDKGMAQLDLLLHR